MVLTVAPEAEGLAERLRGLRTSHEPKLTQADLAHAFGLSVAAISSWESQTRPKPPSAERLLSYALFFARETAAGASVRIPAESELTPAERERFQVLHQELVELRDGRRGVGGAPAGGSIWAFENGPVTIICPEIPPANRSPLAKKGNPNYTRTYRFADLDALIELWGQVRAANPGLPVERWLTGEVESNRWTGHLVVLGGIGWNKDAGRVQKRLKSLPIQQIEVPQLENGEIFSAGGREFWPQWTEYEPGDRQPVAPEQLTGEQSEDAWIDGRYRELSEDVGFLARLRNPYSEKFTLTICSGVYSRGVLGAVKALDDSEMGKSNVAYIANRFPGKSFAMLMRVPVAGDGKAVVPDLTTAENRLYEWSPDDTDGT